MYRFFRPFIVLLFLSFPVSAFAARNIIVMIGDGMGPGIVAISAYYNELVLKHTPLNLERCGALASFSLVKTRSATQLVPDSAAAATAIACGVRTLNGSVGVDAQGRPLENILEYAQKKGKMTGLISTAEIVDATPAGFSAHVARRSEKPEIARQQLGLKINVLMGGGAKYFDPAQARTAGYRVVNSITGLSAVSREQVTHLLALFTNEGMSFARDRGDAEPSLADMTAIALHILSGGKNGFFLMVEGGNIDHAEHARDTEHAVVDTLAFDKAVGVVLDFIAADPDTLLIVTADHDTGGPALTSTGMKGKYPDAETLARFEGVKWISGSHTGTPVPCWVIFPEHSRHLSGLIESTELFSTMKQECR